MPWARRPSLAGALRNVRELDHEREHHFVILVDGTVAGIAGLNLAEDRLSGELQYWVRSDLTRRGVATEAGRQLVVLAGELGLAKLTLWAGRDNLASRRVAEKIGFRHLGPREGRMEGGLGQFQAEDYELVL
jgi:ribosomal-protein-serine acetyltransferase